MRMVEVSNLATACSNGFPGEEKALIWRSKSTFTWSLDLSTDGMFCVPVCIIVQVPSHPTDLSSAYYSETEQQLIPCHPLRINVE